LYRSTHVKTLNGTNSGQPSFDSHGPITQPETG
jgi:hypothetical protein